LRGQLCFRFDGNAQAMAQLSLDLAEQVRALRWRRPNLNDVFLWVIHGDLSVNNEKKEANQK
jgi:hypothetical protein